VVFSFIFLYSWQISSDGHNTTPVPLDATLRCWGLVGGS
jgi:hypothetical protein